MVGRRTHDAVMTGARALALAAALTLPRLAQASPAQWLIWTPSAHTVTLTLIASYNAARHGFNFNGYSTGSMLIQVPLGTHVTVIFHNNGALAHSALVTGYDNTTRDGRSGFPLAFPGAHTPNPVQGTGPGQTVRFSFVAARQGRYAVVCAVGQHARAGMWDTLLVTGSEAFLGIPHYVTKPPPQ